MKIRGEKFIERKQTIPSTIQRKRDTEFKVNVLRAYGLTCFICSLDGRLGEIPEDQFEMACTK